MRLLILFFALTLPLAAQTFILQNVSNQNLDELELFEQRDAAIKQVRDLFIAGVAGTYTFDVAAEVCLELREQLKTDYPTRARVIRAADHTRACRVELAGEKARFMWDGWDWNAPEGGDGDTLTVCASGCDYTTLQAAWDAHTFGDLIEIETESFGGSTTGTLLALTPDHEWEGYCPTYTVIQSADYAANFTPGVRVTAADAANMANLIGGTDDGSSVEHPIRFEDTQGPVAPFSSVNTGTDTITTNGAHGLNVNDEIIFANLPLVGDWNDVTEMGLSPYKKYFVKTAPTSTTFTLSETLGGTTADITGSPGSAANVGMRRANDVISCVRMRGLEIETASGEIDAQSIISMYDSTAFPEHMMSHIRFDHLWLHGADGTTAPKRGINLNGRYLAVRDSLIEEIKLGPGNESYAIEVQNAPGPVVIENNSLSGAGMSIFMGANFESAPYANIGVYGGVVANNNYLWKKPEWYLQRINGAPSGACLPDTQWQDTSGPTCYTCGGGGAWGSADANCNNAVNYEIKNLAETKSSEGWLYEANWADLSPFGDGSQQSWLNVKLQPNTFEGYNKVTHFIGYNFRTRHTAGGPILRGPVTTDSIEGGPLVLWNGLMTDVDNVKYRYETGTNAGRVGQFGAVKDGWEVRHVSLVEGEDVSTNLPLTLMIEPQENTPDILTRWVSFKDNIWSTLYFDSDASTNGCPTWTNVTTPTGAALPIGPNAYITSGFLVHTGCDNGEWEETDPGNLGFADPSTDDYRITGAGATRDYRAGQANDATDGKDMGVDHEMLNDALGGSDPTAGLGSWSSQSDVAVTAIGSTTATVEWDRPNASNACNFYLYSNYARTVEHADTSGDNGDNRDGGVSAGHVTFTLGTNSGLTTKTWYWFEIDCPTDSVKTVGSLFTN